MQIEPLSGASSHAAPLVFSVPFWGKTAFVAVFALLLVWLLLMPRPLIQEPTNRPPWWSNTRLWAIGVTVAQIAIYLLWG